MHFVNSLLKVRMTWKINCIRVIFGDKILYFEISINLQNKFALFYESSFFYFRHRNFIASKANIQYRLHITLYT